VTHRLKAYFTRNARHILFPKYRLQLRQHFNVDICYAAFTIVLFVASLTTLSCDVWPSQHKHVLTVLKVYNLKLKEWHSGHSKGGVLYEVSLVTLNLVKLVLFSETDKMKRLSEERTKTLFEKLAK
jgi:hypothetical protein